MTRPRLSLEEFCRVARQVVDELPEPFHRWLENVVVDVELAPSRKLLRQMEMLK